MLGQKDSLIFKEHIYDYEKIVMGTNRMSKKEQEALKSAESAYCYANDILKGRFEKGEDIISKDARYSYYYARDVLNSRFEKGEDIISKDVDCSILYKHNIYDYESVKDNAFEVGKHDLQFKCEWAVYKKGGDSSICYCTSEERAQIIADALNKK